MPRNARHVWAPQTRFVELFVGDARLRGTLRTEGLVRFLGVAQTPRDVRTITRRHPELADKIATAYSARPARGNNADVLILNGWSTRWLWRFRNVRHAGHVAMPMAVHAGFLLGLCLGLAGLLLRRLGRPQLVCCGQERRERCWLLVWPVRRRRDTNVARRYIPHALGLEGFLRRLSQQGISHAVLRWFENLPALPAGEDLDLLVADEQFPNVVALLDESPGIVPCDLYTVSGLSGSDYRQMAYFLPQCARRLLADAQPLGDLCRVPSPEHQFLSLAYHALYHKGFACGLPRRENTAPGNADSRYRQTLSELRRKLGWEVPLALDDLDEFLGHQGWRPPQDTLARLARKNAWLRGRLDAADRGRRSPNGDDASRNLTRYGRRARLALIEHTGRPAVRKTFKPGLERFCRREAVALGQLSRSIGAVPPLLAADGDSVVYPYYRDVLRYDRSSGKLLPLGVARQAIEVLREFFEAGYAMIDASCDNLLVDADEGLKLFDFEFLYRYGVRPASFEQSYDIAGVPAEFDGDVPTGGAKSYATHWQPYIGLSLVSLLHDPPWQQHLKRIVYQVLHPHRYLPRRLRGLFRAVVRSPLRWQDRGQMPAELSSARTDSSGPPKRRAA